MRKLFLAFTATLALLMGGTAHAVNCDPGLKPDFPLNNGGFDTEQYKKANAPAEDTTQTVMMCFLGTSQGGLSPTTAFNDVCSCKEAIKKHCKIKHGKLKPKGVPSAWCAPFVPFL